MALTAKELREKIADLEAAIDKATNMLEQYVEEGLAYEHISASAADSVTGLLKARKYYRKQLKQAELAK